MNNAVSLELSKTPPDKPDAFHDQATEKTEEQYLI